MWKAPNRPSDEVTQSFNDGLVKIYSVDDLADPGRLPLEVLSPKVTARYEEQRLGLQRYYEGRQNQVQIERVIRMPSHKCVSTQDVAITEDGEQYRIDMVQTVQGVYPPAMDLTLAKIEQKYEVNG